MDGSECGWHHGNDAEGFNNVTRNISLFQKATFDDPPGGISDLGDAICEPPQGEYRWRELTPSCMLEVSLKSVHFQITLAVTEVSFPASQAESVFRKRRRLSCQSLNTQEALAVWKS
ncbi:hypothetical protein NDU88_000340 [Pleurodeles waltl]|uniref:Uncharacterized protein n=1 Tax=Pleurodeles waltl TaxID=8319 RepID=A0AAV7P0J9_PLEWA|nr:hypothetical protein NDU88_000340 [Pleurodeles waltl]